MTHTEIREVNNLISLITEVATTPPTNDRELAVVHATVVAVSEPEIREHADILIHKLLSRTEH